jgi:hypothetical protein
MYITVESNHMFTSLAHQSKKFTQNTSPKHHQKTLLTIYIMLI